jgi:hypothetical protein
MARFLKKGERINDFYIVVSIPFTTYKEAEQNLVHYFLKKYPHLEKDFEIYRKEGFWYVCEKW